MCQYSTGCSIVRTSVLGCTREPVTELDWTGTDRDCDAQSPAAVTKITAAVY